MLSVLLNFILFGIAFYIFQGLLSKKITAMHETHGKIFTISEIKVLKLLFLPFTGCIASILLAYTFYVGLITYEYGMIDWYTYGVLCVAFLAVLTVVGFVYIKAISKAIEDFSKNGRFLITVIKSLCYGSMGLFVLTVFFLLMTGYIHTLFKLTVIIIGGASQVPTFKDMGSIINEMAKALSNTDTDIPASNIMTKVTVAINTNNKPTKRCPCCGEEILAVAKKCKHCGEWLDE